jgi:hypothetical protein
MGQGVLEETNDHADDAPPSRTIREAGTQRKKQIPVHLRWFCLREQAITFLGSELLQIGFLRKAYTKDLFTKLTPGLWAEAFLQGMPRYKNVLPVAVLFLFFASRPMRRDFAKALFEAFRGSSRVPMEVIRELYRAGCSFKQEEMDHLALRADFTGERTVGGSQRKLHLTGTRAFTNARRRIRH